MARVALIFGGRSVEHRVSIVSARTVAAGLRAGGHEVLPFGIAEDGSWVDAAAGEAVLEEARGALPAGSGDTAAGLGRLLGARVDAIFPIVHGTWGEDGSLQGLCEMLDLPYAGAGVTASAVAMDKALCKRLLAAAGVPVVPAVEIAAADWRRRAEGLLEPCADWPLPLFVKPSLGGSSVGVRRVDVRAALPEAVEFALGFGDVVLVEQGVVGRELECAVLGDESLEASAVGEIVPAAQFYDYADKYLDDRARLIAPAELPPSTTDRIRELAVAAFAAIGGSGMARVDFLLGGSDALYVNEINTLPGFTAISMYPRLWELSGVALPELVDRLIEAARARHRRRRQLDRTIATFLDGLQ